MVTKSFLCECIYTQTIRVINNTPRFATLFLGGHRSGPQVLLPFYIRVSDFTPAYIRNESTDETGVWSRHF